MSWIVETRTLVETEVEARDLAHQLAEHRPLREYGENTRAVFVKVGNPGPLTLSVAMKDDAVTVWHDGMETVKSPITPEPGRDSFGPANT